MRACIVALILVLLGVFAGEARAAVITVTTREIAWTQCRADAAARPPASGHAVKCTANYNKNPSAGRDRIASCATNSPYTETSTCWLSPYNEWDYPTANGGCPAGTTWDDLSKKCFSAAACLAKPSEPIGILNYSLVGGSMCRDGCRYAAGGGTLSSLTTGAGDTIQSYVGGQYSPTGSPCGAGDAMPPPNPPPKQVCVGVPGQTMCKRDDGKNCASASTGKQICWDPGETGEKGDGALLQVRNAGNVPSTPQTPPPAGDSFTQQGTPQTASESLNGGSTINTTITNYTTSSGVSAVGSGGSATGGSGSAGEPDDGSTDGGSSEGSDDTGLLTSIRDKLGQLYDGLTGDGEDHAGDGADPSDTNVWGQTEAIDGSALDSSGWLGSGVSCPALWDTGGEGLAAAFAIPTPSAWCDFVANLRSILIATAIILGLVIVANGGKG